MNFYDNDKVALVKASVSDASDIYNFYMEDKEELMRVFSYVNDDLTVEHEEKFFSDPRGNYPFVIKFNNETCGFALLYDYKVDEKCVSVLYYVNSKFRGNNIASCTVVKLLDFAFLELGAERANFYINTDNYASIKVVSNLNVKFDKFLPEYDLVNGKYYDQNLYFVTKEDYYNYKKR